MAEGSGQKDKDEGGRKWRTKKQVGIEGGTVELLEREVLKVRNFLVEESLTTCTCGV